VTIIYSGISPSCVISQYACAHDTLQLTPDSYGVYFMPLSTSSKIKIQIGLIAVVQKRPCRKHLANQ